MTYKEAQELYRKKYGKVVKTCWIADILNSHGRTRRRAWNRMGNKPMYPCPVDVRQNRKNLERIWHVIEITLILNSWTSKT